MHERYGIAAVTGTLLGSKRARLKEIGADSYSSYGALKGRSEGDLRLLIRQMVSLGYLIQTEGEYNVLKLGDPEAFQDKNVNITIKKFEEKPPVPSRSQRSATSSGKAGQSAPQIPEHTLVTEVLVHHLKQGPYPLHGRIHQNIPLLVDKGRNAVFRKHLPHIISIDGDIPGHHRDLPVAVSVFPY